MELDWNRWSTWDCYLQTSQWVGRVEIWWGHTSTDGVWACNSWVPDCRNSCRASQALTRAPSLKPTTRKPTTRKPTTRLPTRRSTRKPSTTTKPTQPQSKSLWDCYLQTSQWVGRVEIWWGHTSTDGVWACNSWVSECRNSCSASRHSTKD